MNSVPSHQDKPLFKNQKVGREPYPVHLDYNTVRQNNQEELKEMRHCDYDNPVTLMAEKAVQLGKIRPIGRDVLNMIEGMNEEFLSEYKHLYIKDPTYYSLIFMFFVWNAGRIEGIRAERRRRKQIHT